jgi:hypothetical protein
MKDCGKKQPPSRISHVHDIFVSSAYYYWHIKALDSRDLLSACTKLAASFIKALDSMCQDD